MNPEVHIEVDAKRTTAEKVALFRALLQGREDVYGSYTVTTDGVRTCQVKRPVTDGVIMDHLTGKRPFGRYLLVEDRTYVAVVDFDAEDANPVLTAYSSLRHYGLAAYIERSKANGFHVWIFFEPNGVRASKARRVIHHVLAELGLRNVEVFPKQDAVDDRNPYGNFINAPLFGKLVPQGRTVFLDPENGLEPHVNQWDLLESVRRVSEATLDEIIGINSIEDEGLPPMTADGKTSSNCNEVVRSEPTFGMPPCTRTMLAEGVTEKQRVSCFRLAVALKKAGVPLDAAIAALNIWALKNRPTDGKNIITRQEVMAQTASAYSKPYRSCGCDDPAVKAYCDSSCPLFRKRGDQP